MRNTLGSVALLILLAVLAVVWWGRVPAQFRASRIELPSGFHIAVFARDIPGARGLAIGSEGVLFVTSKTEGALYAAVDSDGDGMAESVTRVVSGLSMPHGIASHGTDLFLAEVGRIVRYDSLEFRLDDPPAPELIARLPADTWHGWKPLRIGPDDRLYAAVGSPCNVCERDADGFGQIIAMNLDGTEREVYARGVRNSVGFDWNPATGELWFTDNGRDWLGNNAPPDELNRVERPGAHYGFPYCHGVSILDEDFGSGHSCSDYVTPEVELDAHVAALGMVFYTGAMFPDRYRGQIFIAEHGSWNRVPPSGYRITLVEAGSGALSYGPFATGWLGAGRVSGRPVEIIEAPDGSLFVSDDMNGVVYRIAYGSD